MHTRPATSETQDRQSINYDAYPDESGHFGPYGGKFVPETLMPALDELEEAYLKSVGDRDFQEELAYLQRTYVGRPTPVTYARRLSEHLGGAQIYLKREDLAHTGAHKINNALGQALLMKRKMGKSRIVAETGAGQHGVATATAAALLGIECVVYMGTVDMARQEPNVFRMRLLGTDVRGVESGSKTLKDAINEAIRDWVTNVRTTHYLLGSALGPHPYPAMVRDFQSIIGREATRPDAATRTMAPVACRTPSWPASAAAATPSASSIPFSSTNRCASSAWKRAGAASRAAHMPPALPTRNLAASAYCKERRASCCRTATAKSRSRIASAPASTTPASARNTPGCAISAAQNTPTAPTTRPCRDSNSSASSRASSRRWKAPTPSATLSSLPHRCHPDEIILVNLSGRGDKDLSTVNAALE